MRLFSARRLTLAALIPALFVLSFVPGCSNESEGERCGDPPPSPTLNDGDCSDGLVCTAAAGLINGATDRVNRCCYADHHANDSRCMRNGGTNAVTPSGGGSDDAGAISTDAGTSSVPASGGGGESSMTHDLAGAGGAP